MSQQLISRSDDLKRLRDEGYNVEVRSDIGFLLIHDVPYVNADVVVQSGVLVAKLTLSGDMTTTPGDHMVFFAGETPCDQHGKPLTKVINSSGRQELAGGLVVDHIFSSKPAGGAPGYADYYAKMTAYINMLLGHAQAVDPKATPQTFPVIQDDDAQSIFKYIDTASSRAEIGVATQKLEQVSRIAIVGLGGTGAYVLDLVAKTPVREIHLFDGDEFLQHNAFRSPGAASVDELQAKPSKVQYLADQYGPMRNGIVGHHQYLDDSNVGALNEMDFVFLCLDAGSAKRIIIEHLEEVGLAFVDVGMGIYETGGSLGGIVRTTTSTPSYREAKRQISLTDADTNNDYARNIQIADLNALNASLAVIKWKKHCGFYLDFEHEHHSLYTLDGNRIDNEELGDAP